MPTRRVAVVGVVALVLLCTILAVLIFCHDQYPRVDHTVEELGEVYQAYWELQTTRPEYATYQGIHTLNDRLSDLSASAREQRIRQIRHLREELLEEEEGLLQLQDEEVLSYLLMLRTLDIELESSSFNEHLMPITQLDGLQLELPQLISITPFETEDDYAMYIRRLQDVPRYLQQTEERMREGIARGWTVPRSGLVGVPAQIHALTDTPMETNVLYAPFKTLPETIPASQVAQLQADGQSVIERIVVPAFQGLLNFFETTYLPAARTDVAATNLPPNGNAFYNFKIREHTTMQQSAEELHRIGRGEVSRIKAEMDAIIARVAPDSSFVQFVEFMRNDQQFYFTSEEDLLVHIRALCKCADPKLPRLFGHLPRCPYGVAKVPAAEAPTAPAAYYLQPDASCKRAGFYYVNTFDLGSRPRYLMESTTLHETVPGHHLQLALANEMEIVPIFRRYAQWTAFVEGWALYAESLGATLGFYQDDYVRFGAFGDEMLRALRLVVDTGLHALNWTRAEAIDFMVANCPLTLLDITSEVDRYIVWPGQALAYKSGELFLKELRAQLEVEMGSAFDLRPFHDAVLGSGALPLDLLGKNVRRKLSRAPRDVRHV